LGLHRDGVEFEYAGNILSAFDSVSDGGWGLIPRWAKAEEIAHKRINAGVETADTAPSHGQAFRKRRCLIPADGFYEWREVLGWKDSV
jgi:putative SOS response-associated peptidase YedK